MLLNILNISKFISCSCFLSLLYCTAWLMDQLIGALPLTYGKAVLWLCIVVIACFCMVNIIQSLFYFFDVKFKYTIDLTNRSKTLFALNTSLLWMLFLAGVTYIATK